MRRPTDARSSQAISLPQALEVSQVAEDGEPPLLMAEQEEDDEEEGRRRKRCRLILRFLGANTAYEKLVATLVSSPVHVDIVLDKPGTPSRRVCFSAYMNEKFSMTLMPKSMVHNKCYENYSVDMREDDFSRCSQYLAGMVDRTPYNYSDAMLLLPSLPTNSSFTETMVQDVQEGVESRDLTSVYCSQAAVLMCRECVRSTPELQPLVSKLRTLNSRLTSPSQLLDIFQHHSRKIPNSELDCVLRST